MQESRLKTYSYSGPVMVFDICAAQSWKATTMAPTAAKARSNLTYQAKKMLGKAPSAKVTLPGKITPVE